MKFSGYKKSTTLVMAAAGLLLMFYAGRANKPLIDMRVEHKMVEEIDPLVGASPWVRFIQVGLGGFRGVMVDVLWTRATRLQDENKYFELTQLADWISKLEPRVPEVWSFHAWNQAYNISVLFNTPEERWNWVRNGINLLRDEGLRYNPNSAKLHWELGWLYQHKMGADLDDMHGMYKLYWANEMAVLFPSNAPPYEAWETFPKDATSLDDNPSMKEMLDEIREMGYKPTDDAFLDLFTQGDNLPPTLEAALNKYPTVGPSLITFLRIQRLEKVYKLELSTMKEVDEKYGPFDWRLPQAHSTYWAYRGLKRSDRKQSLKLNRMIFQSMASAFRYGKLTIIDENLPPDFSPNLAILDNTLNAYEEALAQFQNLAVDTAHSNLLVDAVMILAEYGQHTRAKEKYAELNELYPGTPPLRDYDTFVTETMFRLNLGTLNQQEATTIIESKLREGFVYLAVGETERAEGYFFWAKRVYDKFSKRANEEVQRLKWSRTWEDFMEKARTDALGVFQSPQRRSVLESAAKPKAPSPTEPSPE